MNIDYNRDKVNNDNDDDDENENDNDNDNDKLESSNIDYGYNETATDATTQLSQTTTTTTATTTTTTQKQDQDQDQDPKEEDWTQIIWDVTSQTKPARTPHERLVMGIILVWTIVLSLIGFLGHYKNDNDETETTTGKNHGEGDTATTTTTTTMDLAQLIVGYVVNFNLVFFYGAPLSAIQQVLNTKRNNTLHVPTMITNTSCAIFWTAYAVAPQINDPFIYVPNGLGYVFVCEKEWNSGNCVMSDDNE